MKEAAVLHKCETLLFSKVSPMNSKIDYQALQDMAKSCDLGLNNKPFSCLQNLFLF